MSRGTINTLSLIFVVFGIALQARLYYLNNTPPPTVKGVLKDVFLGREDSVQNYYVVEKVDTVLQNGINSEKYPYLTETRKITFDEKLIGVSSVQVHWYIWYDGSIIESGSSKVIGYDEVLGEKERLKAYASKRIKTFSTIKR